MPINSRSFVALSALALFGFLTPAARSQQLITRGAEQILAASSADDITSQLHMEWFDGLLGFDPIARPWIVTAIRPLPWPPGNCAWGLPKAWRRCCHCPRDRG